MSAPNGYYFRAARMSVGPRSSMRILDPSPPRRSREVESPSSPPPQQVNTIDLEVGDIDDDDINVIDSPPRDLSQVGTARRTRRRINNIVDLDQSTTSDNNHIRRSRRLLKKTPISSEGSNKSKVPELPRESIFKCPICMCPMVKEMSTMCGHIFCKKCITAAIDAQSKCPTCRKFVTMKELRRVFLPSAN
ncbi:uncharacterized protein LOC130735148 [Lotus japonicus]|uniref:uncharacterized protein LOC130735148 n=1 Tax=Lotus japonicus TaxID=34305 RepID=UPI0025880F60|nr:uncharacterized protein LOC130735148 [Lotus japonicus]